MLRRGKTDCDNGKSGNAPKNLLLQKICSPSNDGPRKTQFIDSIILHNNSTTENDSFLFNSGTELMNFLFSFSLANKKKSSPTKCDHKKEISSVLYTKSSKLIFSALSSSTCLIKLMLSHSLSPFLRSASSPDNEHGDILSGLRLQKHWNVDFR